MGKIKKTTESEKVTESWAELTTGVVDASGGAFSALFTQQLPELSNIEITDDEEQYVTIFTGQQQEDDGFRHKYVMWGSEPPSCAHVGAYRARRDYDIEP